MRRQIQLNVLGFFEIRSGNKIVKLRARKAQALLTYLAVESDRFHSRESLATLLWNLFLFPGGPL